MARFRKNRHPFLRRSFNEGTDLPAIDTILMLRPTESKISLQQLGRGLRRSIETQKVNWLLLILLVIMTRS